MVSFTNTRDHFSYDYSIVCTSRKGWNEQFDKLYGITTKFLDEMEGNYSANFQSGRFWKVDVVDWQTAMLVAERLKSVHDYQHEREEGVELFISPNTDDPIKLKESIKIGARPPTYDLKTFDEVYYQAYLPDHSRKETRICHLLATIAGVGIAAYGIFSGNYLYTLAIPGIYLPAIASHVVFEGNGPTSSKYLKWSILSEPFMSFRMLTGKINEDLDIAGVRH